MQCTLQSKKTSNDQESTQPDPTSCPQNQKGTQPNTQTDGCPRKALAVNRMNSSFPNRWSFSYLKFTKYVTNIIAEPKYKYRQQEQQGTTTEAPPRNGQHKNTGGGGLNRFHGRPTSPLLIKHNVFVQIDLRYRLNNTTIMVYAPKLSL